MQILVLIGLYFLKCTKFDQLILWKIIKIVAIRCQILTIKCTKIDFGSGGAYSAPPVPLAIDRVDNALANFLVIRMLTRNLFVVSYLVILFESQNVTQEAQLMLTNPRDAFRRQLKSPNIVPIESIW